MERLMRPRGTDIAAPDNIDWISDEKERSGGIKVH
jgi:hypothetical protein